MLGAVEADAQSGHTAVLGEVHPIDHHHRDELEPGQSAASSSGSVALPNLRDTAGRDVDDPTGSRSFGPLRRVVDVSFRLPALACPTSGLI